eukprot:4640091-Prymnesium_polylepis.2
MQRQVVTRGMVRGLWGGLVPVARGHACALHKKLYACDSCVRVWAHGQEQPDMPAVYQKKGWGTAVRGTAVRGYYLA